MQSSGAAAASAAQITSRSTIIPFALIVTLFFLWGLANNLNDIAKDHPDVVLGVARRWLGRNKLTDALVKHACRTLLKRGDTRALGLFGYRRTAGVKVTGLRLSAANLRIGEDLRFGFAVVHRARRPVALRLEYAVDFVKASGRTTRKVFKISEGTFAPNEPRQFDRKHRFRDFTTRKHHPGEHRLTILINGEASAEGSLQLSGA